MNVIFGKLTGNRVLNHDAKEREMWSSFLEFNNRLKKKWDKGDILSWEESCVICQFVDAFLALERSTITTAVFLYQEAKVDAISI